MPLQERAALALGDVLYTSEMGRRTYVEAALLADELLRAGWPVVVDGRFSHAAERSEAMAFRLDASDELSWSGSAAGAKTGTRPPMGGRNCWPSPATDTSHRLTSRGWSLPVMRRRQSRGPCWRSSPLLLLRGGEGAPVTDVSTGRQKM